MRHASLEALRAAVADRGWVVTRVATTQDMVALAESLGPITPSWAGGPVVDELRPKPISEAAPRSLSGMHGLGAFPFHTDAAHHPVPPRFVLLRLASQTPSLRRTLVAPIPRRIKKGDRDTLEHDVWLVDGGREPFLTSILTPDDECRWGRIRFDEGCMCPADRIFGAAREIVLDLARRRHHAVTWVPGRTIVIDNWRALHARDEAPAIAEGRVLERILVSQP